MDYLKHVSQNLGANPFVSAGVVLVFTSLSIFMYLFYPVVLIEAGYFFNRPDADAEVALASFMTIDESGEGKAQIAPKDENFSVIIPKIGANGKAIANVNPFNKAEYQYQLERGIAHAQGTALPGQPGNGFFFAHSAVNFYEANRHNVHFYLLNKLDEGDTIYVVYEKEIYKYKVSETKTVKPTEIDYLISPEAKTNDPEQVKETITLMTCWPAGTDVNRLIVIAERVE